MPTAQTQPSSTGEDAPAPAARVSEAPPRPTRCHSATGVIAQYIHELSVAGG